MVYLFSLGAKLISFISKTFNLGNGSTWPGHIALSFDKGIVKKLLNTSHMNVILIAGTNGKTTTGKILTTILTENGQKVVQNTSGANLLNGITSALLLSTNISGKLSADYGVFEVDENNLPIILEHITPKVIIALNLFRDQLDRYGELDSIAKKWNTAFQKLTDTTTLILNADDPLIAYLAKDVKAKVSYFGLSGSEKSQQNLQHASDSIYCPNCGNKLIFKKSFYSHLGIWECSHCGVKRPLPALSMYESPLPGVYNKYNTLAAVLTAQTLGLSENTINSALPKVTPAFGRQEKITYQEKSVQLFLSKNPVSMNESLAAVEDLGANHVLFVLNDRIPDGRDVSWIWDIDIERFNNSFKTVVVSGDRTYDMALRLQYAQFQHIVPDPNLESAISTALDNVSKDETLFVLPTYSAMLDVRKILTGKKIL